MNAQLRLRYECAMHAVQSGIAFEMGKGSEDTLPKHLRVGVNSALISNAALVRVLVRKGIISDEDYFQELVDETEREVKRYEARNGVRFG